MPTPRMRSVSGSMISLVKPSGRSKDNARPEAAQGNLAHLHRDALGLGLGFRQAAPGEFRVGEDDGGDRYIHKCAVLAGDDFDCNPALLGRLVGQQDAAGNVANRVDRRVGRLLLLVDMDEALLVKGHLGVFQAEVVGVGRAADGDQHAVVKLFLLLAVASRTRL